MPLKQYQNYTGDFMKAVITAADEARGLKPLTCTQPFAILGAAGRPIIDYTLDLLCENGFDDIYITLNYLNESVRNYVIKQNRNAKIHFVFCGDFLGTAGSVKEAVKESTDPVLVIECGVICDFRLDRIMKFHETSRAAATVVTSKTEEPSGHCVVCSDADSKVIRFIDKPSFTQAVSNNAYARICVLSGEALSLISQNHKSDLKESVFSPAVNSKGRIFEYRARGYWNFIEDFESYKTCVRDLLDGKANLKMPALYKEITRNSENNLRILPPSYIGKNVVFGKNAVVGPYTVIGDGCRIEDGAKLHAAVIGRECRIGKNCKINSAVIGDNCDIKKDAAVFENAVIGDRVSAGAGSTVACGVKIWPNKRLGERITVSQNIKYSASKSAQRYENADGGAYELTAERCSLTGAALASLSEGKKTGVAHDGKPLSKAMLMCACGGMLSAGSRVWNFGECFLPQLYFYTSYCSLDCGVYVSSDGDEVKLTLFSQGGLSLPYVTCRELEKRISDRAFSVCAPKYCKTLADMSGVGLMYQRELLNQCPGGLDGENVTIISENEKIELMLNDCLHRLGGKSGGSLTVEVSADGLSIAVKDNRGETLDTETALAVLCMFEAMSGKDIAVPYDAPAVIDRVAEKYSRKAYRYLAAPSQTEKNAVTETAKKQLWARDALMMTFRLLNIIKLTGMDIAALKASLPKYNTVRRTVSCGAPLYEIADYFQGSSALLIEEGEGIEIKKNSARALIIPKNKSRILSIISESVSAETADSLCDEIAGIIGRADSCRGSACLDNEQK